MTGACNAGGAAAVAAARRLFAQKCEFIQSAARLDQIPVADEDEVAFAGRSNVGKSSLVNSLVGQKALARSSTTPGRTRQINFFDLGGRLMLVDLPGYGYARASRSDIAAWTNLVCDYLRSRANLRRVCLLIDSRHGPKDTDFEVMSLLDEAAVSYLIVLTKIDKLDGSALGEQIEKVLARISKRPAAHPFVLATSVRNSTGIGDLRLSLAELVQSIPRI